MCAIGSAAPVGGDVTITALGRGEADAVGSIYGGGGLNVVPPRSNAVVDPTVDAHIGTAAAKSTTIAALGNISLTARLTKAGNTYSDLLTNIDISRDTLTFSYPNIGEGAQVMYSAGATTISGLHSGNVYTLLSGGGTQIRLGSLFDRTAIDAQRETISFNSAHGYVAGDCIYYDSRGGGSIIAAGSAANDAARGCGNGAAPVTGAQAFFVRVINPNTIQLTSTYAAATATDDATIAVTPVDATHVLPAAGSGLTVGTLVVYRAPVSLDFSSAQVNVELTSQDVNGTRVIVPKTNADGSTAHNPAANNVYVGTSSWNQLNNGDALNYTVISAGGGIGLDADTTYFVIKGDDQATIRLAATYCQAVGDDGSAACKDVIVTALTLTITGPDTVEQQLDRALGSLVDGRTYFITSIDAVTGAITLSTSPFGAPVDLDAAHRPGEHDLGRVEIDLQVPAGTGQQALFANLSTTCSTGCGRLLAPSGQPLSTVSPPVGDGISAASAHRRHRRSARRLRLPGVHPVRHTIGVRHHRRHPGRRPGRRRRCELAGGGHLIGGHLQRRRLHCCRPRGILRRPDIGYGFADHPGPVRQHHRRPGPDRHRQHRPLDQLLGPVLRRFRHRRRAGCLQPGLDRRRPDDHRRRRHGADRGAGARTHRGREEQWLGQRPDLHRIRCRLRVGLQQHQRQPRPPGGQ